MRKAKIIEGRTCPKCGESTNQIKVGTNRSGTQRCKCNVCNITYTLEPKSIAYPEEVRAKAIKTYYSGVSGRGVGNLFGFSKANVYNWIKKTEPVVENSYEILEMDELYWFVFHKPNSKTRENVYVTTLVSRTPRQIVGFDVAYDKAPERLQKIVDQAPNAAEYATDGFLGYVDVVYPGKHIRNVRDKNDTYTVESINADLRHYIPILARRSRCFARTLETLFAVVNVFVEAYNKFGQAKLKHRERRNLQKISRELPFGLVDFI